MRTWLAAILLLVPAPGIAQDLAARVTPAGLDTLTDVALARVPRVFPIERLDPVLFDCPGDDVVAHVPPTDVNITFRELDIRTDDGLVVLSTTLDIDVANTIQIDNPNACFGTALCDVSATLDRLGIVVELAAATSPSGGVEFHGARVDLDLSSDDLALVSEGCAVGDVATWLFDAFEAWALELLTPRLEALIGARLGEALTTLFAETVGVTIEREGFTIEAWLDALDFTRLRGVTVGGGADLTWTGAPVYEDPAPATEAPSGAGLPDDFAGELQVAVTDRLVTEALYEAWRGGLMRRLLADQSQSIELAGDGAAASIGLGAGTRIDIAFDIERPLVARFGRVAPNVAEMTMEQLHVTVGVVPPSGPPSTIEIYASGSMQASMTMSDELGGMVMDVQGMELSALRIEGGGEDLALGGERLSAFVQNTVAPMLAERLTGLPVAPGVHAIAGMLIHVRAVESAGGWQRVGADLVLPDPDDVVPPETILVDPATLLPAGTAAFAVSGSDAATPEGLLRYRAWLDGTPLAEGAVSSSRVVRFDVADGEHTLEVAAVDANDNVDPTPAMHVFQVDGNPPELVVTRSPAAILQGSTLEASWTASDAEGPVESRWVLREIGDDGMAFAIQEAPFSESGGALSIGTNSLRAGTLYELEIVARDEAGNLTSQAFGFALEGGSLGCGVAPVRRAPGVALLLALAVLVLAGARARRRYGSADAASSGARGSSAG